MIELHKYLPQDFKIWGVGRIVITTQNSNIQSGGWRSQVIQVPELDRKQKQTLFLKIMDCEEYLLGELRQFLEVIPPFPLDVSIAAYYLKTTGTSFAQYLQNLQQYNFNFEQLNTILLKDIIGFYTKTRYHIIIISLQNLIEINKDFIDLLILLSLLDSQNIPYDLLIKYKDNTTVDNFVYHLNKYSLIADRSESALGSSFSLHRITQTIMLQYLTQQLNLTVRKGQLFSIVTFLETYIEPWIYEEDNVKLRAINSHCVALLNHSCLLTDEMMSIMETISGSIDYYLCYYPEAKRKLENATRSLRKFATNDLSLAKASTFLGVIYRRLENFNYTQSEVVAINRTVK